MSLIKVDISAVRNIKSLSIRPSPAVNLIYGKNASGKSAFLESLFILGRAKSFRTTSIKSVIHFEQPHLLVSALTGQTNGNNYQLGIQLDGKNTEIRINQQSTQRRSDLAYTLPLQLIHPKSYELLDAGPQFRREFLDWGVFNEFPNFLMAWRNYKKALLQRNSLLKSKHTAQINVWDKELVNYGTIVNDFRQQYLQQFSSVFIAISNLFLSIEGIEINYLPGWDINKPFQQVLIDEREKDLRYGFTHSGAHRGDFQLLVNKRLAKDYVSRGQLKLLVLSLKLAQVQMLAENQNQLACVLIDDFAAELDSTNRAKLLNYLAAMNCQVFITATEMADFGDLHHLQTYKMFHMEHGNIKQM
jgi:DNA replication and repair protein RecF